MNFFEINQKFGESSVIQTQLDVLIYKHKADRFQCWRSNQQNEQKKKLSFVMKGMTKVLQTMLKS
jgi:hypothetical protein